MHGIDNAANILVSESLRAAVLLVTAGALCLLLRRAPARLRSTVWSVALLGALVIPAAAYLLPPLHLGLLPAVDVEQSQQAARDLEPARTESADRARAQLLAAVEVTSEAEVPQRPGEPPVVPRAPAVASWRLWLLVGWLAGLCSVLGWQIRSWLHLALLGRTARPANRRLWQPVARDLADELGVRAPVRVLQGDAVQVPVTWGVQHPRILLPAHGDRWCPERRNAVLLHEMVHIARGDWMVRTLARLACALYWFNPLTWLALRQLTVEQELACDQEVLARGMRPSDYAAHLLAVARASTPRRAGAVAALGIIRRGSLEGRIMAILDPKARARARRTLVLVTALSTAGLIPAVAAVQPWAAPSATALEPSATEPPDLEEILDEMAAVEERMQPQLDRLEAIEAEMEPELRKIEEIELEIEPFDEQIAGLELGLEPYHELVGEIEAELAPLRSELEKIEIDMAPVVAELERLAEQMVPRRLELEQLWDEQEGLRKEALHEAMERLQESLEPMQAEIEKLHGQLAPYQERMEQVQEAMRPHLEQIQEHYRERMEPLHHQIEKLVEERMRPHLEKLEAMHESMAPFHERMEEVHREMEPLHREMDRLHHRLEEAVAVEIAGILRSEMASVARADAPFSEAAARVAEAVEVHVDDARLRLDGSAPELAEILVDLLEPYRAGASQGELAAAARRAAERVLEFELDR